MVSSGLGLRECRKAGESSESGFRVRVSLSFLLFLLLLLSGGVGWVVLVGRSSVRVRVTAWITVALGLPGGSAFYDLTVAKDQGPYAGD